MSMPVPIVLAVGTKDSLQTKYGDVVQCIVHWDQIVTMSVEIS